jgi:hypothetical protein
MVFQYCTIMDDASRKIEECCDGINAKKAEVQSKSRVRSSRGGVKQASLPAYNNTP